MPLCLERKPLVGTETHTNSTCLYGKKVSGRVPTLPSRERSGAGAGGKKAYFSPHTLLLFFDVLVHEEISHFFKNRLILLFKEKINFVFQRKALRLKALDSGPKGAGTALGPKWNNG